MGYLAPAGTAIAPHAAAAALLGGAIRGRSHEKLARVLAAHSGHARAWLVSTGRAAMTTTLTAMKRLAPERTEVIVPAYTCYSVPAAVKLAGLTPRLCDVDARTLSPDLAQLERFDPARVLAVVSANLYGLPNALTELESFAKARGYRLLDDAAQGLGARFAGRPVGGFGDAGLYSFDKGKNITSIEGGAIVSGDAELCAQIDRQWQSLLPTRALHTATVAAKLMLYSVMLRPVAYGIVNRLPLGLGQTPWEDNYPLARYSPVLAAVTLRLYRDLDRLTRSRSENAARLAAALSDVPGVSLPAVLAGAEPAWTRFPLFISAERRARALVALQSAGIGATASYPRALCDVPEVLALIPAEDATQLQARRVADTIVTLPTHQYVPEDLGSRVRDILLKL